MDRAQETVENYANPKTCFFHVLFKAAALGFYVLSALFVNSFVIIFVLTVLLAALDFWVVKNVSGRILVGLRWWNEINDQGESIWKFECLDQESLSRMNKKDSWLFWWTLYLSAVAWIFLGIFSLIRFQADYLLVVGVCLSLSIANIVGFTKCRKGCPFPCPRPCVVEVELGKVWVVNLLARLAWGFKVPIVRSTCAHMRRNRLSNLLLRP